MIRSSRGLDALAFRKRLLHVLAWLGLGSLLLSGLTTRAKGPWAYFGLHTRAWELAAGGLLALAVPALSRVSRSTAAAAGWVGLAAVVGSAVLLSRDTAFPGTAAAWPVVGTVLAGVLGYNDAPTIGEVFVYFAYLLPVLVLFLGRHSRRAATVAA